MSTRKLAVSLFVFALLAGTAGLAAEAGASRTDEPAAAQGKLHMKKMKVNEFFEGQEGTIVLRDVQSGETFVYNEERANTRLTPESTFKVPNALIGLQVKAVRDEYDVKRWDGVEREFETWNRDHTLGSAMRESAIWYYQDMAKNIGEQSMKQWLDRISYGNRDISGGIDRFWLDSSLKITPAEEAAFMEQLLEEELPFDRSVMKTVKRMMILDEGDDYTLYGKTGTRLSDMGLGWFVGFLQKDGRSYVFACNVAGSGSKAKTITLDILRKYKLLPAE